MITILFFMFLFIAVKGIKSGARAIRGKPGTTPTAAENNIHSNLASLEYLQEQRDILTDLLENAEFQLSMCPPEKQREKLLKDKARIYGQLSTVESKITKLIG